jgi:hypothetical protein
MAGNDLLYKNIKGENMVYVIRNKKSGRFIVNCVIIGYEIPDIGRENLFSNSEISEYFQRWYKSFVALDKEDYEVLEVSILIKE